MRKLLAAAVGCAALAIGGTASATIIKVVAKGNIPVGYWDWDHLLPANDFYPGGYPGGGEASFTFIYNTGAGTHVSVPSIHYDLLYGSGASDPMVKAYLTVFGPTRAKIDFPVGGSSEAFTNAAGPPGSYYMDEEDPATGRYMYLDMLFPGPLNSLTTPFKWTGSCTNYCGVFESATGGDYFPLDITSIRATGNLVPEPASWGLMVLGAGLAGAAVRRRRGAALSA